MRARLHFINASDIEVYVRRLVLFCAILMSGGLLLFPRVFLALIIFLLGLFYFKVVSLRLKRKNLFIHLWLFIVLVVTFQFADSAAILIRFINFLVALIMLNIYWRTGLEVIVSDLISILRPMAYQSVLTVLLALLLPSFFIPINILGADINTFLFVFNFHNTVEGVSLLVRPDGFFYEPGVFQIYLNIYLFLIVMLKRPVKELLLATLAVFLTQSTTGLVISILILFVYFYQNILQNSLKRKVISVFLALILAYPVFSFVYVNINKKLFGEFSGSSLTRLYDLNTGLSLIKEYPLTGIGFSHSTYLSKSQQIGASSVGLATDDIDGRSTSNGLVYLFYSIGIPLGMILFIGLYRQRFFEHRLLFGAILTMSLLGEALIFTPIFLMFAFSGLVRKKG